MYYSASGKAPAPGVAAMLLVVLIIAPILSAVYATLMWFILLIYVNIVILAGFAFGLYWCMGYVARMGKVRNVPLSIGIGVIAGITALYFDWAFYASFAINKTDTIGFGGGIHAISVGKTSLDLPLVGQLLTHPAMLWDVITQINGIGMWSIFSLAPTGFALWIVWLIEAGVIIVGPAFGLMMETGKPFSEVANSWMPATTHGRALATVSDTATLKQALEADQLQILMAIPDAQPGDTSIMKVTTYSTDGDDAHYLSLDTVTTTTNKKGEQEVKHDNLIQYLTISPDVMAQLQQRLG